MRIDKISNWFQYQRECLDDPIITKDTDHLAIWTILLSKASYDTHIVNLRGKKETIEPGELVFSALQVSEKYHINKSKVDRIIRLFERSKLIEKRASKHGTIIKIIVYGNYVKNVKKSGIKSDTKNDRLQTYENQGFELFS